MRLILMPPGSVPRPHCQSISVLYCARTLTVDFRTKLEALVPVVRGAITAAEQAALETEEETNAEVEVRDIIEELESALGRIESVLTDP